ncbi:hypothetical protein [Clostridium sp. E02]|uniref:hypothetical protein n=1 Tax=Clostridium sp. E02 TaxID=2487134 RepID=UPI000F547FD2|nr:hypothetical protein [Clostridium sp. E02]
MRNYKKIMSVGLVMALSTQTVFYSIASETTVPTCDETLYITMDPYGDIKESSIVKTYELNGSNEFVDYGTYEKIINLTDHSKVISGKDGSVTFKPEERSGRFYFEGQTKTEKNQLPWEINVSYRLNGVIKKAEELAGEKGLVEVNVDLIPNKDIPDYYRNNMTLMASVVVDMDKNLSLEAEGTQIQTVGDLKTMIFFALPGEECHYTIRIGSDKFQFPGLVFAMVPLTVSQLDKVNDLRDARDTVEDSADSINDSLTAVLDTMDQMQGSIKDTAEGVRGLNQSRQLLADSKGKVYENADEALAQLEGLSQSIRPFSNHAQNAQTALNDMRSQTNHIVTALDDLSPDLGDLQDDIRDLRDELRELKRLGSGPEANLKAQAFVNQVEQVRKRLGTLTQQQTILAKGLATLGQALPELSMRTKTLDLAADGLSGDADLKDLMEEIQEEGLMDEDEISSYLFNEKGYSVTEIKSLTSYLTSTLETDKTATPSAASRTTSKKASKEMMEKALPLAQLLPPLVNSGAGLTRDLEQMLKMTEILLSDLNGVKDHVNRTVEDTADVADSLGRLCDTADNLISEVDELNGVLNRHHEEMIGTLTDLGAMTDHATRTVDSLNVLFHSMEIQMKIVGESLNQSSKTTLNGLAGSLDGLGKGLDQTEVLKNAKDTIKQTLDDKWDEYTKEDTTILNSDWKAFPISMTSEKNPAPKSIQMILRTEEIKIDANAKTQEVDEEFHPDGNVFHRIGNIFKNIFHFFTSIF